MNYVLGIHAFGSCPNYVKESIVLMSLGVNCHIELTYSSIQYRGRIWQNGRITSELHSSNNYHNNYFNIYMMKQGPYILQSLFCIGSNIQCFSNFILFSCLRLLCYCFGSWFIRHYVSNHNSSALKRKV